MEIRKKCEKHIRALNYMDWFCLKKSSKTNKKTKQPYRKPTEHKGV